MLGTCDSLLQQSLQLDILSHECLGKIQNVTLYHFEKIYETSTHTVLSS